uniref:Uncharacterized protein n=1 Tax=Faecalibaculum rodentium TaxID=1702221 RepID=A0A140DYF6_9FIRM|nr:hypothetical protein AALO17_25490 [Faecalibaculum rodentium]
MPESHNRFVSCKLLQALCQMHLFSGWGLAWPLQSGAE